MRPRVSDREEDRRSAISRSIAKRYGRILKHVVGEIQVDEKLNVRLSNDDLMFLTGLQERGGNKSRRWSG